MITFILWLLWIPLNAQSFYTESGYARFGAKSNLNSYQGISRQLKGEVNLETRAVHFNVPVKSFDTGNGKRNRDMYKLLDAEKNQNAQFYGEIISPLDKSKSGVQKVTVSGIFSLNGTERPLEVEGTLQLDGDAMHIEAGWFFNISDYDLKPPRFLINEVKDRHSAIIKADLSRKDSLSKYDQQI